MKKILVPCDFSSHASNAYQTAIGIAKRDKGRIFLLHVLPMPYLYSSGYAGETLAIDPAYYVKFEEDAKLELDKMMSQCDPSVPVSVCTEYGDLVTIIKHFVKDKQIDLVLMGTSGASGIQEIFIGSNTEKVVRFSSVPVLAVRDVLSVQSVKHILVPSTLDLDQTDYIKKLKELQLFFGATLHILYINTPTHFRSDLEINESLTAFAKHYDLTNYKLHFRNYSPESMGILAFANVENMDLIAMGTHARKGLAHLFNSSVSENVVNHAKGAIWTYCLKRS